MSSKFDFYVHGLWIIGAVLFFLGGLIAGNVEWIEGTTEASFAISVLLSFALFLTAGMCWISASVNARHEETATRGVCEPKPSREEEKVSAGYHEKRRLFDRNQPLEDC